MTNEEIKKVEGLMRSIKDFPAPGLYLEISLLF